VRAIVGLGNPGRAYVRTRHNVGFRCVELLARRHELRFSQRREAVTLATGQIRGHEVVLVKPRTFVNESGRAATYLQARFRLSPGDLLVVLDDLALPLGKVRIRPGGSSGGHNGLQSMLEAVGTEEVPRIRVGIGPPDLGDNMVRHVLSPFRQEEMAVLDQAAVSVADAIEVILDQGLDIAMSRFN